MLAPLYRSFEMAREDLDRYTAALTEGLLWARPGGAAPVGFHIRHAGRSAERLMTYAVGGSLSAAQRDLLATELDPGEDRDALLRELNQRLDFAWSLALTLDPERLAESRGVGRLQLPTTVIGLVLHTAEHTQRHVGQAITTAHVLAGAGSP
jgi:hypothetical protein